MQKNSDLVKLAIWVGTGVLAGALITVGIQHCIPASHHEETPEQASAEGDNTNGAEAAGTTSEAASAAQAGGAKSSKSVESPYPVSAALAVLNNGSPVADPQTVVVPPNQHYSENSSGYPIYTGGRAIDSAPAPIPGPQVMQVQPVQVMQVQPVPVMQGIQGMQGMQGMQQVPGNLVIVQDQNQPASQPVGRNGLLSNPCVDPPSVHGLAYNRRY